MYVVKLFTAVDLRDRERNGLLEAMDREADGAKDLGQRASKGGTSVCHRCDIGGSMNNGRLRSLVSRFGGMGEILTKQSGIIGTKIETMRIPTCL